jgi:hypothetical protein
MATGTDVVNAIPLPASDKTDATLNLAAVNYAIQTSWPLWRMTKIDTAGTIDSLVYEYSLVALTDVYIGNGVAQVSVDPDDNGRRDISNHFTQYYDQTTGSWILVADDTALKYDGEDIEVHYQYPHPALSAIGDTVYAPIDAMAAAAFMWLSMRIATERNVDNDFLRIFATEFMTAATPIWRRVKNLHLQHRVAVSSGMR